MQFLRRFARYVAGLFDRRAPRNPIVPLFMLSKPQVVTIHREVTRHGVKVFSLCGSCGARLECSATLCEECAQGRSRSTPGF